MTQEARIDEVHWQKNVVIVTEIGSCEKKNMAWMYSGHWAVATSLFPHTHKQIQAYLREFELHKLKLAGVRDSNMAAGSHGGQKEQSERHVLFFDETAVLT